MPIQYTFVNNIFFVTKNCFPIFTSVTKNCILHISQHSPLTLFERLLLGSKMNLQAASLCSPYAKVTIFSPVKF